MKMARKKHRILLVEDSLPMARVYQEYLAKEPYDVIHVAKGQDALEELSKQVPSAVLLDMKLPDMNGMDILDHIRTKSGSFILIGKCMSY